MAGAFETATRAAIEELIMARSQASKFGFILTEESFKDLTTDIYNLLVTSRTLKAAGDRFLRAGAERATTDAPKQGASTNHGSQKPGKGSISHFFKKRP